MTKVAELAVKNAVIGAAVVPSAVAHGSSSRNVPSAMIAPKKKKTLRYGVRRIPGSAGGLGAAIESRRDCEPIVRRTSRSRGRLWSDPPITPYRSVSAESSPNDSNPLPQILLPFATLHSARHPHRWRPLRANPDAKRERGGSPTSSTPFCSIKFETLCL